MTPTTEAGRYLSKHTDCYDCTVRILAIEAEAAAAERERLRGEVEALPQQTVHADPFFADTFDYQTVGRDAVLALLADPAEPEAGGDA